MRWIPVRGMPRDQRKPPRGFDIVQQTPRARALDAENRVAYRRFLAASPIDPGLYRIVEPWAFAPRI